MKTGRVDKGSKKLLSALFFDVKKQRSIIRCFGKSIQKKQKEEYKLEW